MKTREERRIMQKKLLELQEDVKETLLKYPNVVNVAVGLKEKGGKLTNEIVFQVFVREKIDELNLTPDEVIPKEIMGYKTDVIRLPNAQKRADSGEHRPIKGGIQIGNGKGHVGTLGCFARIIDDDTLVLLSNHHVLYSDGAVAGDKIGQPDIDNVCCCCCAYINGEIGILLNPGFDNDDVDCAIASINAGIAYDIILNNSMTSTEIHISGTDEAVLDDTVRKIGRTSGLTTGTVWSITGDTGDKTGQIFIKPVDSETYQLGGNGKRAFSDGGDSGSVIINEDDNIVGLLWGGDPSMDPQVDITFACHIGDVLDAFSNAGLEIEIELTPPGRSSGRKKFKEKIQRLDLDLRYRLLETEKGTELVTLFEKHQKEVLKLINNNRQVMITWQRHQGPAFIAHIMKSNLEPEHTIPSSIKGIGLQELLIKMASVLKENSSSVLKEDIERNALWVIQETYGLNRFEDLVTKIEESSFVLYS